MTQNIYDNPEFFEGYSRLGRSVQGLEGAAEWPALRALLPSMHGLRVTWQPTRWAGCSSGPLVRDLGPEAPVRPAALLCA